MIRALAMFGVVLVCQAASLEWPQFEGPRGNFKSDATGLANSWPPAGPKVLWKRALGDGYSAVSIDGNVIYTMYRALNDEVVLAAEADTGKTYMGISIRRYVPAGHGYGERLWSARHAAGYEKRRVRYWHSRKSGLPR